MNYTSSLPHYTTEPVVVLDLETTIRNRGPDAVGKQEASPFHPDNKIWLYGSTYVFWLCSVKNISTLVMNTDKLLLDGVFKCSIIIGQNIKFDLLYLLRYHNEEVISFFKKGGTIWDTQQVEYLLSAQQEKFIPLSSKYKMVTNDAGALRSVLTREGLASKYGGTDKNNRIEEYWNNGIDTPDIPQQELIEYAHDDLRNTFIVFKGQLDRVLNLGDSFIGLVGTQMRALEATIFMEYNGMKFDIDIAHKEALRLAQVLDKLESDLIKFMYLRMHILPTAYGISLENVSPLKLKQVSAVLFGGVIKYKGRSFILDEEGQTTVYKTGLKAGMFKTRIETNEDIIEPLFSPKGFSKTASGDYVVDDLVLHRLIHASTIPKDSRFCEDLIVFRRLRKELKTYFLPYIDFTWPTDSCIHSSLNMCSTDTGRLSSSNPNLQNVKGN